MEFEVITRVSADEIIQEVNSLDIGKIGRQMSRRITEAQEEGLRDALIHLGWRHPDIHPELFK